MVQCRVCNKDTKNGQRNLTNYGIPFLLLKANWRYFPRLHNSLKSWTLNNCIYKLCVLPNNISYFKTK